MIKFLHRDPVGVASSLCILDLDISTAPPQASPHLSMERFEFLHFRLFGKRQLQHHEICVIINLCNIHTPGGPQPVITITGGVNLLSRLIAPLITSKGKPCRCIPSIHGPSKKPKSFSPQAQP